MQRKDIKIGADYCVEVDGLQAGAISGSHGDPVPFEHGYTYRGIPQRGGRIVRATVKALDQKLPTRGGFYASFNSKGVLVEFSEPVKVGMYSSKKSVKTAVLDTRHILQLWSEYEAREAERAEWVARHKVEADKASAAFAEVLDAVKENMRQKGFTGIGIHTDGSGLYFSGGSISLVTSVCSDGVARPTSFGLYGRITVKDFIMMLRA